LPSTGGNDDSTTTTTTKDAVVVSIGGQRLVASGIRVLDAGSGSPIGIPGDTVTWTYTAQNVSDGTIDNITAWVVYPDDDMIGVSATTDRDVDGSFSRGSLLVDFNIGTLNAGELTTLTIVTRLPDRAGIFRGLLTASINAIPEANAELVITTVTTLPTTGEMPLWAKSLRQLWELMAAQ
jgi:hypothetical protein